MSRSIYIDKLLSDEQKWRRRRTIADNKLAEIHAKMRAQLSELYRQRDAVADALKPAPAPVVAKRGAARKFNKETE